MKNGFIIKGKLNHIDYNFNLYLKEVEVKSKENDNFSKNYQDLLIRGSSIKYISFTKQTMNP